MTSENAKGGTRHKSRPTATKIVPRQRSESQSDLSKAGEQFDLLDVLAEMQTRENPGRKRAAVSTDPWWLSCAMAALRDLAATQQPFQAWDLTQEPYCVAEPSHYNHWGALLHRAAKNGLIEQIGAVRSKRPTTLGSLCYQWRGVG